MVGDYKPLEKMHFIIRLLIPSFPLNRVYDINGADVYRLPVVPVLDSVVGCHNPIYPANAERCPTSGPC